MWTVTVKNLDNGIVDKMVFENLDSAFEALFVISNFHHNARLTLKREVK